MKNVDEERLPVPSAVMSTKILGVSEKIASVQLIVVGLVIFCVSLAIASFAVNVASFEYSKDTKFENHMLVEKSSGIPIDVHPQFTPYVPTSCDFDSLHSIKEVTLSLGKDVRANYMVSGVEALVCPHLGAQACQDGLLHVIHTFTPGRTMYAVESETGKIVFNLLDEDFLKEAFELTKKGESATKMGDDSSKRRNLAGFGYFPTAWGKFVDGVVIDLVGR